MGTTLNKDLGHNEKKNDGKRKLKKMLFLLFNRHRNDVFYMKKLFKTCSKLSSCCGKWGFKHSTSLYNEMKKK